MRATGIASLKVGYNRVFGYFFEVRKTHSDHVPEDYVRRQTLTNAERYVTDELKTLEQQILERRKRTVGTRAAGCSRTLRPGYGERRRSVCWRLAAALAEDRLPDPALAEVSRPI